MTIWSSALKLDLKIKRFVWQSAVQTGQVNYMHAYLAWLMVEQKMPLCLLMLLLSVISTNNQSSLTHHIQYMVSGHGYSLVPAPRTNFRKCTVTYRSTTLWNSLSKDILSTVDNKITFKKHTKKYYFSFCLC